MYKALLSVRSDFNSISDLESKGIQIFRVYILYKHIFNETVDKFAHIAVVLEFPCTQLIIGKFIGLPM